MIRKLGTYISVAAIAFLVYIFAFYIEGQMGVVLITFLIVAPLISIIIAVAARKRVNIRIDSDAFVKKGSELEVTMTVEKRGRFPFAIIEIAPEASEVFEKSRVNYHLSLLFEDEKEFTYRVPAKTGGNGEISVGRVSTCGFLGFLKLKVKSVAIDPISIGVIPEIPDIKPSSQLFRQLADVVMTSDEEEDNDSSMMYSVNSAPGYEHREYVQGDPLKRVNWKLSSKKDKLMVRLDEAVSSVQPMLILDLYRSTDADPQKAVVVEEQLLRSVFGLLRSLVKQGIACNFAYCGGGNRVIVESVDNPDYVDNLLLKVLSVKVVPGYRIDVNSIGSNVCACVVATTDPSGAFSAVTERFSGNGALSVIVPYITDTYRGDADLWYLDEDNDFKPV